MVSFGYLDVVAFADAFEDVVQLVSDGAGGPNKVWEYEEMEGDHVVPWSKDGKTVIENCQMLCKKCNGSKNDK